MSKGFGNILKQAQQMHSRFTQLQEEMAGKTIEASSGGGMVSVVAVGFDHRAANASSSAFITGAGSEAEEERMRRSRRRANASAWRSALGRIAWCMVGTAVYQVASACSSQPKNLRALKPGGQWTLVRETERWTLHAGAPPVVTTGIHLSDQAARKLLFNALGEFETLQAVTVTGQPKRARPLLKARSVVV